jgi:crotonobetainyl-CoA:carnitine CoA-transferase CaiB-like acyl-CoA transferase
MPKWPFSGLRVLELATGIAGPYAGKLLCDLGGEVVKLEEPGGDPQRSRTACGHRLAAGEDAALFRFLNASKRSAIADLNDPDGKQLALELAARADIVLESFGPGGLARRGLDVETLRARNPRLSLVSISPWGLTGPWAQRPATEFTQQATAGSTARRALPGRVPVAAAGHIAEFAAGAYAGVGAVAAWLSARRTGEGQHVDLSLFETVVTVLTTFFALRGHWIDGPMAPSAEAPSIEPAADGWVGFCTYTGQQWTDFCGLIERPDLAQDERFFHAAERFKNRSLVLGAIHAWTQKRSVAEIVEAASLRRVPAAPVLDAPGVLACDHFRQRGVFTANPHGFRQPRVPYRFGEGETRTAGRAPGLGEHTAALRAELQQPQPQPEESARLGGSSLPLEGLRVIDLTAFWAGPVATGLLGSMGADVVKIESIQRPDGMRFVGATGNQPMWEWSEVFHGANPGKRSVTLNLDTEAGKQLLLRLVRDADVVAENASARVLDNFGLGFEKLREHNADLILLRMPAWGLEGPWRDRPGFAANVEQAAGLAWRTGYRDAPLVPLACDPIGGSHAALALLAALEMRRRTGRGQQVETALVEPALNVGAQQIVEWDAYGAALGREENRSPDAAPQGVYRCQAARDPRDPECLALSICNDAQWQALGELLGSPAWARDPSLAPAAGRRAAHDRIDAELSAWLADVHAVDVEAMLLAAGIPAACVENPHFLLPNPQLEHRGFWLRLAHPVTGETPYPKGPLRFSAWGTQPHLSPPPTLGQHNDAILGGELGLSEAELAQLRKDKVIGERPAFL